MQAGFAQRLARCCMLPDSPRAPPRRKRSKLLDQTAGVSCPPGQWDVQCVCQLKEPSCFFSPSPFNVLFHVQFKIQECLEILSACSMHPSSSPLTRGPALCQAALPSQSCPKCDMKYESRCASERVINTASQHLSPCALTNMLPHTHGHNRITNMHACTHMYRHKGHRHTKPCVTPCSPSL